MAGLTKEHARIIDYVEAQGVKTTRTTKGLLFRAPNGETTILHWTESDWRATRNFRGNLRRMGIEYPGDYTNSKKKKPYRESIEKIQEALKDLDPENVKTTEIHAKTGMTTGTISNVMIYLGYWHDFKKKNSTKTFVWHPPIDPKEIIEPVEDMKDLVEYTDHTHDEVVTASETVNILTDTINNNEVTVHDHNSWIVQLDGLDGNITIDQLRIIYMAAGFNLEVRLTR